MRQVLQRVSRKWSEYKFRFVPWLVFNLSDQAARQAEMKVEADRAAGILLQLQTLLEKLENYPNLKA